MYNLAAFASMIRDEVRMNAYHEALRRTVKPGSIVIDLGTGTGIFAFIACQLGAKHVYAIDPNPLIDLGHAMSAANDYTDRITFIKDVSTKVQLEEKADVLVGDLRGQMPLYDAIIPSFYDARMRLLKPDGVLIPQRDILYASMIQAPMIYQNKVLSPWKENTFNLDMSAAMPMMVNTQIDSSILLIPEQMLLGARPWMVIEYGLQTEESVAGTIEWTVETPGTTHFVYLWFDTELTPGQGFSNAPGENRPKVYGSVLLPLTEPIKLEVGERLVLTINADPSGRGYVYRWNTDVYSAGNETKPRISFKQSNFFAMPLSGLIKRTVTYKPHLSSEGQLSAFIMNQMNGEMTLEQISKLALEKFPDHFDNSQQALAYIADISQNLSE